MPEPNVFEQKDLRISKAVVVGVAKEVALEVWKKYEVWDEKAEKEFGDIMSAITQSEHLDILLSYIYSPMSLKTTNAIKQRQEEEPPFA